MKIKKLVTYLHVLKNVGFTSMVFGPLAQICIYGHMLMAELRLLYSHSYVI